MRPNPFRSTSTWTLLAGIGIGAVCMASLVGTFAKPNAAVASGPIFPPAREISATSAESAAALRSLDQSFANLAEFASPAVVQIVSESKNSTDMFGRMMPVEGEGSGVIIRPDGYIVTNDHVVGGFDKVKVFLKDGRDFPGKVMRAEDSDIAVVKIDAQNLPTLAFADSSTVKPGEFSMAIGSPFGFDNSVTVGHISALGRSNSIRDGQAGLRVYTDLIQTDTPINMGNSGGPLLNVDGQIIGINTSIYSQSGGSNGIGFAIPSNQARLISEMLIEGKKINRGAIGLVPEDLKDFQKKKWNVESGALVVDVPSNGPAAMAGIKVNDIIVRVGNYPVKDQMDVRNSMLYYPPKSKVDIEYIRDGQHHTATVTLTDPKALRQLTAPTSPDDGSGLPNMDMPDLKQFVVPRQAPDGQTQPHTGKAKLGVSVITVDDQTRKAYGIPARIKGALVVAVSPGSVAERLGINHGDVITQLGDTKIESADQLTAIMKNVNWGDRKSISFGTYSRDAQKMVTTDVVFQ